MGGVILFGKINFEYRSYTSFDHDILSLKVSDCDVALMPENHCYAVSSYSDTHCETTPATEETFNVKLVKIRRVVISTPDDNNNVNNRNMVNSNYNAEEFIRSKVVTAAENGISNSNNNNSKNNNNNNRLPSSMSSGQWLEPGLGLTLEWRSMAPPSLH